MGKTIVMGHSCGSAVDSYKARVRVFDSLMPYHLKEDNNGRKKTRLILCYREAKEDY